MKPEFGEDARPRDKKKRAAIIRSLFISGRTIAAHTEYCIDAALWTKLELRAKATKACRDEVRDALGDLAEDGMPFAGSTAERKDGAPVWKQRDVWLFEDYVYNCAEYAERVGANAEIHNRLADECHRRYGMGPKRIRIIEEEEPFGAGGD